MFLVLFFHPPERPRVCQLLVQPNANFLKQLTIKHLIKKPDPGVYAPDIPTVRFRTTTPNKSHLQARIYWTGGSYRPGSALISMVEIFASAKNCVG